MPRLIDLGDVLAVINASMLNLEYTDENRAMQKAISMLPTVDIDAITESHEKIGYDKGFRDGYAQATSEVRHGHWKRTKAYPNIIFCDECGEAFEQRGHWNYCPNCGATMDDACGRWHKQGDEYRCSECGDTTIVAYKNCPNCGARMDEVAEVALDNTN